MRTISSTGSPLAPESFDFVYDGIKQDVHLASISGGTDIVSCFVLGVPTEPVWRGEIQGPGLGMAVDVWDDDGKPLRGGEGRAGLHQGRSRPCRSASGTIPDGKKYHAAYFERFDNVWCHGDFAEWTAHGGMIIHGRSDATLNPGGVRIGTAEIYRQVEQMPEIARGARASARTGTTTCASCCSCGCADGVALDDDLDKRIQREDPHRRQPAPRAGEDRRGRRHSAHQVGQDHRARGARRRARPRRSRTRRRSPIPRRWSFSAICRNSGRRRFARAHDRRHAIRRAMVNKI